MLLFSIIYGIILPIDELIFFKMVKTANQVYSIFRETHIKTWKSGRTNFRFFWDWDGVRQPWGLLVGRTVGKDRSDRTTINWLEILQKWECNTVDGRNPAPVDRWFIPFFIGFQHVSTIQGGAGFLPSTVGFTVTRFCVFC